MDARTPPSRCKTPPCDRVRLPAPSAEPEEANGMYCSRIFRPGRAQHAEADRLDCAGRQAYRTPSGWICPVMPNPSLTCDVRSLPSWAASCRNNGSRPSGQVPETPDLGRRTGSSVGGTMIAARVWIACARKWAPFMAAALCSSIANATSR
jgi:hypothetical protein